MDSTKEVKKRSWLKIITGLLLITLIIGGLAAFYVYNLVYGINLKLSEDRVLTIPEGCTSKKLSEILEEEKIVIDGGSFLFTSNWLMSYVLKSGKYKIPKKIKTNKELIQTLRGVQLSIRLTFHNFRVKEQLAGYVGSKIAADSSELIQFLEDSRYLEQFGYTPETVLSVFIPNTYEVYWNCSVDDFWKRMIKEHKKFWTSERLEKAKALELSPTEVYTLASIVECESQYKPERPRIAGVYLNRLKKNGWKLEADPTVVYAVGDFTIRRVLNVHLETDSPYNTYKYAGLPPGPIYMSSINSIDAVLNYEQHDYMFFCAKPREEGQANTHAFAKTHNAHLRNARRYWKWLRSQR
jgi:UPF0755 protein